MKERKENSKQMTQHIERYNERKNRTFEGKENDPLTESWEVRE